MTDFLKTWGSQIASYLAIAISIFTLARSIRREPSFQPAIEQKLKLCEKFSLKTGEERLNPEMVVRVGNDGDALPSKLEAKGWKCRAKLYVNEKLVDAVSRDDFKNGEVYIAIYASDYMRELPQGCLVFLHWIKPPARLGRHGFLVFSPFANRHLAEKQRHFRRLLKPITYVRYKRYHLLFHKRTEDELAEDSDALERDGYMWLWPFDPAIESVDSKRLM